MTSGMDGEPNSRSAFYGSRESTDFGRIKSFESFGSFGSFSFWSSEFDKLLRVMREIQSLLVWNGSDSPLLHRKSSEQNLDVGARLVLANLGYHQRVG